MAAKSRHKLVGRCSNRDRPMSFRLDRSVYRHIACSVNDRELFSYSHCPTYFVQQGLDSGSGATVLHLRSTLHLALEFDLYSICIHKSLAQYTRFLMHNLLSRIVIVNILLYSESTGSYYLVYSHRWTEYSIICFFKCNHKR